MSFETEENARRLVVALIEGVHGEGGWWFDKFPEVEQELWGLLGMLNSLMGWGGEIDEWPQPPPRPVVVNLAAPPMECLEVLRRLDELREALRAVWPQSFTQLRRCWARLDEGARAAMCD